MNNQLFPFYQTFIHKTCRIDKDSLTRTILRNQNTTRYFLINSERNEIEIKKKLRLQLQFVNDDYLSFLKMSNLSQ